MPNQYLPCLFWLKRFFVFRIFCKYINFFGFWWKTLTKHCTSNVSKTFFTYILQLITSFQFENMIWKTEYCLICKKLNQKYGRKNSGFGLFCFCLLRWLFAVSIVAASKFNYLGPIMWIVLDRFNSFLTLVSTIKNYVTIVKYITHGFFLHASRESKIWRFPVIYIPQ